MKLVPASERDERMSFNTPLEMRVVKPSAVLQPYLGVSFNTPLEMLSASRNAAGIGNV